MKNLFLMFFCICALSYHVSGQSQFTKQTSAQNFTLQMPETIAITYPIGGEVFDVGSNPIITYTSIGNSGLINLDYSTDGGVTWDTIATNTEDDGDWTQWIVPNKPSTNCKIRVSDVDGNPSVVSNGSFTIFSQFTEALSISGGSDGVVLVDYDNDGDLDIFMAAKGPTIYKNEGNINFVRQTSISLKGLRRCTASWGDYDNDGDLDLIMSGHAGLNDLGWGRIIYRNDANNTFTKVIDELWVDTSPNPVGWGDYNNDGDLDFFIATTVYKNKGDGTFSIYGINKSILTWGDLDNDGDLDILVTSFNHQLVVYRNNGNNTFTQQILTTTQTDKIFSIALGDYDNNGNLDILLAGKTNFSDTLYQIEILQNNGNDNYTSQFLTSIPLWFDSQTPFNWGDYDNDGDLDILFNTPNNQRIYRNNGNNTFSQQSSISSGGAGTWGDLDNDGDLDIVLFTNGLRIFRNNNAISNTLPNIPSNLQAIVSGNDVTFSWDKSTDNETPQNGLKYNLVIGTSPDSVNILSPMSARNTGYRRIINLGNTNHNNSWTIKNLPNGQYYWSVQAIDNCFAGSAFAATQSFTVQTQGTIAITYPTGGEVFEVGSNPTITYTSIGNSGLINLDYSTDGGVTWDTIATNTEDDGDWRSWIVPNTPSTNCKIRVSDADGYPSAISSGLFIIQSTGTIIITYPTGGEVFSVGSNPIMTYSSIGNSGLINLDYSTDGGVTWDTIATNTEDDGDWRSWIVPNTPSTNCKIRISDVDGNPSVVSNGSFTIFSQFTEQTSIQLFGAKSAAWGDYDNDGDLDIILIDDSGSPFYAVSKIYRNNGNNTFTEQTSITLLDWRIGSAAWGDYDNDGDLDIIITGNTVSKIYRNDGNNIFTEQTPVALSQFHYEAVAWSDYDNDGDLDFILTGQKCGMNCSALSKIYMNNGDNTFIEQTTISIEPLMVASVAWGDYDNDGNVDLFISGFTGGGEVQLPKPKFNIYRNNGNNSFTMQTSIDLCGKVDLGDYDNDGDLDIFLAVGGEIGKSKIYRNNGDNTFTEQTAIAFPNVSAQSVDWGDYDNDGNLDILLTGSGVSKVYRSNGNNTFTEQTSLSGVEKSSAVWGDYDNDGDLDILLSGETGGVKVSKIYRNNNVRKNTLSSSPTNLQALINGNDVTFSWDKSTDNETPQNGLHYNIVIGTTPNGVDKLSPMSNRSTGFRRVVRLGNSQTNSWTIKNNLLTGHYYWSVQAIDNCLAGSAFAPEQDIPLPVELTSFTAEIINKSVKLKWQTATEINNYGFEIERKHDKKTSWDNIGFVEGSGNSNSPKEYSFIDKKLFGGTKFSYRLKQIDQNGTYEYSKIVEVELPAPKDYALYQNFPNPFNPSTKINWQSPVSSWQTLKIYDVLGNEVATLVDEYKPAGSYEAEFQSSVGSLQLASGIYYYQLVVGDFVQTKKMILLR